MDTRKIAAEYRLGHWVQIIKDRRESGESVKEYCEKKGICENAYYYWQRKIREAASVQLQEKTELIIKPPKQETTKEMLSPVGFMEVKVSEPPMALRNNENSQTRGKMEDATYPPARENEIKAEVSGIKIKAGSGYPIDKLTSLLRELARE